MNKGFELEEVLSSWAKFGRGDAKGNVGLGEAEEGFRWSVAEAVKTRAHYKEVLSALKLPVHNSASMGGRSEYLRL